jgi:hypothetical protein
VAANGEFDYWDPAGGENNERGQPLLTGTGPTFLSNPWNTIIVQGIQLPGLVAVKCEPRLQLDQAKAPGVDGAKLTLHGYMPGPVEISITMWTQAQWTEFMGSFPILWSKPQKDDPAVPIIAKKMQLSLNDARLYKRALTVEHPVFTMFGIRAVVTEGVSAPEDGPIKQSMVMRIKCREYEAPTKRKAASKVSSGVTVVKDLRNDGGQEAKNAGGEPPSKTDMGPRGPKPDRTAGAH